MEVVEQFKEMNNLNPTYKVGETFSQVLEMIEDEEGKQAFLNSLTDVTKYYEMYDKLFKKYPYMGDSGYEFEIYENGDYKRIKVGGIGEAILKGLKDKMPRIYAKPMNWELCRQANSLFKIIKKVKQEKLGFYDTVDSLAQDALDKLIMIKGNNHSHEESIGELLKYFSKGDMVSYLPIGTTDYLLAIRCVLGDIRLLLIARMLVKYLDLLDKKGYVLKKIEVDEEEELRKKELKLFISADID